MKNDGRLQDANTAGSLIWELHIHSFFTIAVMTKSPQSTLYVFDKQSTQYRTSFHSGDSLLTVKGSCVYEKAALPY